MQKSLKTWFLIQFFLKKNVKIFPTWKLNKLVDHTPLFKPWTQKISAWFLGSGRELRRKTMFSSFFNLGMRQDQSQISKSSESAFSAKPSVSSHFLLLPRGSCACFLAHSGLSPFRMSSTIQNCQSAHPKHQKSLSAHNSDPFLKTKYADLPGNTIATDFALFSVF